MGATIKQKQQNLSMQSVLTFHPNFTLNPSHILVYQEDAVIFEVPSSGGSLNSSNYQTRSALSNKSVNTLNTGLKNKIGLTCTINRSQKVYQKYIMKRINVTAENQSSLGKSLDSLTESGGSFSQNICKLVGYKKEYDGLMCGMHSSVSVVFQYLTDHTLAKQMQARSQQLFSKTKRITDEDSLTEMLQYSFHISEILHCTRFLLQMGQKLASQSYQIPKLILSDVIFEHPFTRSSTLKYRNPLDSIYCKHNEAIHKETGEDGSQSQQESRRVVSKLVENIGICVMSMCLLEDCYESCFNFIGEMCISVVQKKIEYIYQLFTKNSNEKISGQICKMLQTFTLQKGGQNKITLNQAKSIYNKIYLNHEQQRRYALQSSYVDQQGESIQNHNKNGCPREEDTSASMERKTKKQDISSTCSYKPIASKQHFFSMSVSSDKLNKVGSCRGMSVKQKKDWKIDKSSQRKIQINQTIKPRTKQWTVQQEQNRHKTDRMGCKEKANIHGCFEIDKKWSEDEQLFKHMPEFERFSSQMLSFHFNAPDLEPIQNLESGGLILLK